MHGKIICGLLLAVTLSSWNFVASAQTAIRISEIHYDNIGTDSGEAIEISGPAGASVAGWQVILYNGNGGASYDTRALSGTIPATCDTRGVLVLNYAVNGIQNGSPDGIALIDAGGNVVEFLSYEGPMTATNGPASGLVSVDIGVTEPDTTPVGLSLARNASGVWSAPATSSFGTCNDNGNPNPPAEVTSVTVSPALATVLEGATQTFTATALDAASQPVAGVVFTWTSSATAVATVNASGLATAITAGDTVITATAPNGIAGSAALHVDAAPTTVPDLRFTEIHYDNLGTDTGEAIEIEGPAGTPLTGISVILYNGNGGASYNTQSLTGTIPATCGARGVVVINYPTDGIQNGSPDGFALAAGNQLIEFLSYEGTFAATNGAASGITSTDILASQTNATLGLSLQRDSQNRWRSTTSTFGACNVDGDPTPGGNRITFTGRLASDAPLPVGFEDQIFATLRDANNVAIPTTITWATQTPSIASIDQNGVLTALAAGSAILQATAADGTTGTLTLPTRVAIASTTAEYAGNTEFGEPQDGDASDDFIVRYAQYTSSYNPNRGTPNWISYNLDPTHFGPEDRCDCFTSDPALPGTFRRLSTNDYTNAGAIAGFPIDRGHLVRSFDRTSASLDNAVTYYFTNIVPQTADLNQGPWSDLEFVLGDLVRFQDREVYIVTGVAGNRGTLKNEGKVVIPTSTWKVAVILGRNQGLADIDDYTDLEIIAVNMPNDPGVRNIAWQTYQTTVDSIEALTGYDLLSLLPDDIEQAVESATRPPIGAISGPAGGPEGTLLSFSAAGSVDPNGSIVSYAWNFGDGTSGSGAEVTHAYTQDGIYNVTVVVTDNDGLTDTATASVAVTNVAPIVGDFPGATLTAGQAYTAAGAFTDPGDQQWTATVNWGDGSALSTATLTQRSFSLAHTYPTPGTYTVTVSIADDDTTATRTQTVTVNPAQQPLSDAKALVDQLVAANKLSRITGALLKAQIATAEFQLARGLEFLAAISLRAIIGELDLLVAIGRLSAADAAPLRTLLVGALETIGE